VALKFGIDATRPCGRAIGCDAYSSSSSSVACGAIMLAIGPMAAVSRMIFSIRAAMSGEFSRNSLAF
jgi:hypothetical protein